MARIRKPEPFQSLMAKIPPQELLRAMSGYGLTNAQGEYLPWDKFQWRVSKGEDKTLAWVATKMARMSASREIPELCAETSDDFFRFTVPESLQAKLHYIDKLVGGNQNISDHPFFNQGEKNSYLVRSLLMEEAITSSQLEGASTTRKVAKEMLQTERQPKDKSEQMIANNYRLMKTAVERREEDLSLELILEFHQIATHRAIDNNAVPGEFRASNDIDVRDIYDEVAHIPPSADSIEQRMQSLCEFANYSHSQLESDNFIHPLIKAITLHFMVAYIHPFGDGNGRTARALFYWFMLKSGYWLFEYVSISKLIQEKRGDYDKAFVYTETDDNDLTYFIYHQVGVVVQAVNALQDYIQRKQKELHEFMFWLDNSTVAKRLKRGQLDILRDAVKSPGRVFTVKSVANDLGVGGNTARHYLNDLADRDLLIPAKSAVGKALRYIAPANLRDALKS